MRCPKCGKEVELQTKKVGTNENGDPVYNEYAICRDCKKQWNLDKQRAKKAADAAKKTEAPVKPIDSESPAKEAVPVKKTEEPVKRPAKAQNTQEPVKKPVKAQHTEEPVKKPAKAQNAQEPVKRPAKVQNTQEPVRPAKVQNTEEAEKRPVKVRKAEEPVRKPVQKISETTEQKYSNIPPKKVRASREEAVKNNYETMLATNPDIKESSKKNVIPKFRILRILLGIISLAAFGFFCYKGLIAGLDDVTSGNLTSIGSIYIILATCMLISGLLLLILQKKNSLVAFLIPTLFYLGSAVFSFFMKSKDLFFLYVAVIFAVMTIIMLILTFASRGNDEYDDDDFDDDDDFNVDDFADDDFDDDDFDDDDFDDDEFDEV